MNCTLDGCNAQVIAKAIQSLSKFGTDLFVESDTNGFVLRSINTSKSAVGTIKFKRDFFESYIAAQDGEDFCKLSMKASLAIFRNMKQVERCEIKILPAEAKFQVQLKCRLETVRNTSISIVDEENINAAFAATEKENVIVGSHRIFIEISGNFNIAEEEITLEARNDSVTVKNYIEGSRVNDKFMRSQLKLPSGEFEKYNISQETTVTFCLKEFRAFLMFAETLNESIIMSFREEGSPLILKISKSDQIECTLIMSTLCPEDVSFYHDVRESEVFYISNTHLTQKRKLAGFEANNRANKSRKSISDETTQSNDSAVFQFNNYSVTSVELARNCLSTDIQHLEQNNLVLNLPSQRSGEVSVTFVETEESKPEEEYIPQSPQALQDHRNLRSIFSRCFQSTYVPEEPTPDSQVFVPNSDTED